MADRLEIFFKAAGWRVVPLGGAIGVRSDSRWDVPEPEVYVGLVDRSEMVRTDDELVRTLQRCYTTPDGAWLLTGTGIVPPASVTLLAG